MDSSNNDVWKRRPSPPPPPPPAASAAADIVIAYRGGVGGVDRRLPRGERSPNWHVAAGGSSIKHHNHHQHQQANNYRNMRFNRLHDESAWSRFTLCLARLPLVGKLMRCWKIEDRAKRADYMSRK